MGILEVREVGKRLGSSLVHKRLPVRVRLGGLEPGEPFLVKTEAGHVLDPVQRALRGRLLAGDRILGMVEGEAELGRSQAGRCSIWITASSRGRLNMVVDRRVPYLGSPLPALSLEPLADQDGAEALVGFFLYHLSLKDVHASKTDFHTEMAGKLWGESAPSYRQTLWWWGALDRGLDSDLQKQLLAQLQQVQDAGRGDEFGESELEPSTAASIGSASAEWDAPTELAARLLGWAPYKDPAQQRSLGLSQGLGLGQGLGPGLATEEAGTSAESGTSQPREPQPMTSTEALATLGRVADGLGRLYLGERRSGQGLAEVEASVAKANLTSDRITSIRGLNDNLRRKNTTLEARAVGASFLERLSSPEAFHRGAEASASSATRRKGVPAASSSLAKQGASRQAPAPPASLDSSSSQLLDGVPETPSSLLDGWLGDVPKTLSPPEHADQDEDPSTSKLHPSPATSSSTEQPVRRRGSSAKTPAQDTPNEPL